MTDKQNAKLNMAQRVSDTMKDYGTIYNSMLPMNEAVTELKNTIVDIHEAAKEQTAVNVPASTKEKREVEEQMIDRSVRLANALYVIGFKNNNKELTSLLGLSPRRFYRSEDNAKLTLAKYLYDLAQQNSADLMPYGFQPHEINDIGVAIDAYKNIIAKPMSTITVRKQKTTNLRELFANLDSIFYDKLDKLIVLFKESNPDFYGEYRTSRNYINTSVRYQKEA